MSGIDTASQELYFQKLDEQILDEDQIVTCSSAAHSLKVSSRDAKDVLAKYVTDRRKIKPNELGATYILAGLLHDGTMGIAWVEEAELLEKKKIFSKITSEFISSVQKCKVLDLNLISSLDFEVKEEPPLDSVVSATCIKRDVNVNTLPIPPSNPIKEKKSFFTKIPPKTDTNTEKAGTSSGTANPKPEPKSQPKVKASGAMANFLAKASTKSNTKITKRKDSEITTSDNSSCNFSNEKENLIETVDAVKLEVNGDEHTETPVGNGNDKKTVDKKRKNKSKGSDKPMKKRRRIRDNFDSESSDDIFGGEDDDIIEKSFDEPELSPPTPPPPKSQPPPTKGKCRKAVTKTYMDEEGYCVTNTEYVFESVSEDEKEDSLKKIAEPVVKEKPSVLTKKNSSTDSETDVKHGKGKGKKNKKATAGNQPTLMSFFKKA